MVRQRFADEIKTDIVESLVPRYFREEAEKQNLVPISQPRVTDLHLHDDEPLKFTAEFEILPEIKLAAYDDIKADTIDTNVSEEDVETGSEEPAASARHLQRRRRRPRNCRRRFRGGQFPRHSGRGRAKATTTSRSKSTKSWSRSAATTPSPSSPRTCAAPRPATTSTFDVKYADDFSDKRLAGKTLTYEVDVKSIKTRSVPEPTDEFAKELVADFATYEDLRNRLRENMKAEKEHEAEHQGKDKIVAELVERNDFPVPDVMVDQQIDLRLERGLRALAAQGMRDEDMKRMDFDRLRAGQREGALREVKASLILEQIAEQEKIEVSDEEIEAGNCRTRLAGEAAGRAGSRPFDAGWWAG